MTADRPATSFDGDRQSFLGNLGYGTWAAPEALNNDELDLWKMSNGYALLTKEGLLNINAQLSMHNDREREALKENLKVGIQWNTEVTLNQSKQIVSQVYCSALPVSYTAIESVYFENFARLILEATYEATLYASLINLEKNKCPKLYLTIIGGGAFGNKMAWIIESMSSAIKKFKNTPLEVGIVSYGGSKQEVREMISAF